jgi:hypothetical protein
MLILRQLLAEAVLEPADERLLLKYARAVPDAVKDGFLLQSARTAFDRLARPSLCHGCGTGIDCRTGSGGSRRFRGLDWHEGLWHRITF